MWKMFGLIAEVIGHEHITERRDPCIRFERLARAMDNRAFVRSARRRAGRAEQRLQNVSCYIRSALETLKDLPEGDRNRKRLEYDLRLAERYLGPERPE